MWTAVAPLVVAVQPVFSSFMAIPMVTAEKSIVLMAQSAPACVGAPKIESAAVSILYPPLCVSAAPMDDCGETRHTLKLAGLFNTTRFDPRA